MIEWLSQREVHGGKVVREDDNFFKLLLPALLDGSYGLSQLDDYMHLPRYKFPHIAPVSLRVEAKAARRYLTGTWGFGFWNDPFSSCVSAGGMSKWLPVLPNAAWFFYGSQPNRLSLRDDLPGSGFHMKTFRSPLLPSFLSLLAVPAVPLVLWPGAVRIFRRFAQNMVREASSAPEIDVEEWHSFRLDWMSEKVVFSIDQIETFTTSISPLGCLGLVIWIDNQYFYLNPDGRFGFGSLPTQEDQTLLIRNFKLDQ